MIVIPLQSLPAFSFEITLNGSVFRLSFRWNSRGEFWTMDIQTISGVDIARGIKLVLNYELILRYANESLPKGAIIPIDITGKLEKIGRNDLGGNIKLVFISREELDGII